MKRLLFISFDFPPRRTSGVYRHVGLTKYMVRFGWQSFVLTARLAPGEVEDRTLLKNYPAQVVIEPTSHWSLSGWEGPVAKTARGLGALRSGSQAPQQPFLDRWLRKLGDFVQSVLYFPDRTVGWVPFAVGRAVQLHFQHHFDLIYTTSPPRSSPVIGLFLKWMFRVPWVAEFRDPWYAPPGAIRKKLERWLLARILRACDGIVLISQGLKEELHSSFAVPREKMFVVSNGFDEDDFEALEPGVSSALEPGYVHLSHFGTVYPNFSGVFFPALSELLQQRPELKHRLRVNIIGFPDDAVLRFARQNDLRNIVQIRPFMQHREALCAMFASDCLLLFLGSPLTSRLSGLGKIFWYLRVGRPVLAVAPEGGTRDLIEQGGAGWVIHPEDKEGIKQVLQTLLTNKNDGLPHPSPEYVAQFRYDRLAGQLARILEEVART